MPAGNIEFWHLGSSLLQRPCSRSQRSCGLDFTILISTQLSSVVSVLFNAPRRSSSRSVRQLMKERELFIRSVVNLILAVYYVYVWLREKVLDVCGEREPRLWGL